MQAKVPWCKWTFCLKIRLTNLSHGATWDSRGGLLNCGLRATDCIAGCGSRAAGHTQIAGCGATDCWLRVVGHTRIAGCGPQIAGCRLMCCGLRATCCGLLILLVAKLQVAKMSCCELLNCRLRFARLFRLGQGVSQRPVHPSFGRAVSKVDG